jgi:hypothetical protein
MNRHFCSVEASLGSDVLLMVDRATVAEVMVEVMAVALMRITLDFVAFEMAKIADPFQLTAFSIFLIYRVFVFPNVLPLFFLKFLSIIFSS